MLGVRYGRSDTRSAGRHLPRKRPQGVLFLGSRPSCRAWGVVVCPAAEQHRRPSNVATAAHWLIHSTAYGKFGCHVAIGEPPPCWRSKSLFRWQWVAIRESLLTSFDQQAAEVAAREYDSTHPLYPGSRGGRERSHEGQIADFGARRSGGNGLKDSALNSFG